MRFTKMHGLSNDYVFLYGPVPQGARELAVRISDRRTGVGSDGLICITPSRRADFGMRMFNADGSEAEMCGNGIRCVGKYAYDRGLTNKTTVTVDTLAGIKTLNLDVRDGKVSAVTVHMGNVQVEDNRRIATAAGPVSFAPVSTGNPHAVVFVENAEAFPVEEYGPLIEKHPSFPRGTNAHFVQVLSQAHLRVRVWERGSGMTRACGTGACACAAAAVKKGYCPPGVPIRVTLDGGTLEITVCRDGSVTMKGPAVTVFDGEWPDTP